MGRGVLLRLQFRHAAKALNAVGGALPTGSITEDMLLTLAMLRKGYITRYLCERLAYGLAPEKFERVLRST